ncbi:MAG: NAD(P)(+) transhydrogenase (Re/Si-specific) subunit beta [Phycisphaerales bacterium]|nr:NAD(P)(+) transhydrogenase (Re/Si-specific) subunit beta [Phycisphaerales bacterium]
MSVLIVIYLVSSIAFIVGLKQLSHPDTARIGNFTAAFGMIVAIVATIFLYHNDDGTVLNNRSWIFVALIIGTLIGVRVAQKVQMTQMPEMVSLFNGTGGACAMLIAIMEYQYLIGKSSFDPNNHIWLVPSHEISFSNLLIIVVGMIIGTISFSGSIIAYSKLNGTMKDISFKGQHVVNLFILFSLILYVILFLYFTPLRSFYLSSTSQSGILPIVYLLIACFIAFIYGIFFVLPIGGADMPVVISLLNSFTGVAAGIAGILYNNRVMITGGILVGAAGTLLTILMCKAMNRSLKNVLIGSFSSSAQNQTTQKQAGVYKEIMIADVAMCMAYANKVIIVPGYGLAVAQAQHSCHELEKLLENKGVQVKYAIHPVAGRMPGHMNVLLAEANVPYDKLIEMEEANSEFTTTDVVLVLGANDVVNPAAKTDTTSPIYGMPILEVDQAKCIIINKRTMKPGYAGIENELFFHAKTSMVFGDAKEIIQKIVAEIKAI